MKTKRNREKKLQRLENVTFTTHTRKYTLSVCGFSRFKTKLQHHLKQTMCFFGFFIQIFRMNLLIWRHAVTISFYLSLNMLDGLIWTARSRWSKQNRRIEKPKKNASSSKEIKRRLFYVLWCQKQRCSSCVFLLSSSIV